MKRADWETGIKIAKLFLTVAAVYLGMRFLFPMALPFLIALALARILYPLALKLEEKFGLKRAMARFAAYGVFLACVGAAAAVLLFFCYRMGSNCLSYLNAWQEDAYQVFCRCCERLEGISGFRTDDIRRTVRQAADGWTDGAVQYSKDAGWYMIGLLAKIFVAFVAAFLMLNDYERMMEGIRKTQGGRYAVRMLRGIKEASGAYIRAQLCIMGIVTAICILGLFLLQIPHAFWIGLAIGICDALPFLGTGTVFVPWALVELLFGNYKNAAGFLAVYIVTSFARQLLEPRLVGRRLGVPPLAVLMSIYIGIQVYGGAGVILGPVSALIIYEVYKGF